MEDSNNTLQEQIQSFVTEGLDEQSRTVLLQTAKQDPTVADELAFGASLALALRNPAMIEANRVLAAVIAEEGFPPPIAPARSWKWWSGASILALVLVLGGFFLAENMGYFVSESQTISRDALKPLENVFHLPDQGQGLSALKAGMEAYDKGQYAPAALALESYLNLRPDDDAVRVYLGVSKLMIGKSDAAETLLAAATQSEEPPIQEAALWYLALSQLENNKEELAQKTLQSLPVGGIYEAQAKALLAKMK